MTPRSYFLVHCDYVAGKPPPKPPEPVKEKAKAKLSKSAIVVLEALSRSPLNTNEIADLMKTSREVTRQRLDRLKDEGLVKRRLMGAVSPAIWSLV